MHAWLQYYYCFNNHFQFSAPVLNSTVTITTAEYSKNGTLIQLSWMKSAPSASVYHVEVLGADPMQNPMASNYHQVSTSNTSIQLWLEYTEEFNVTILASNCVGNSTPVETTYRTGALDSACIMNSYSIEIQNERSRA